MLTRRSLTAAQQYINLRANPVSSGMGELRGGRLVWRFETSPSPLSRKYAIRLELDGKLSPEVYVESPDLHLLAEGRPLPHVYQQEPLRLCLFLPGAAEYRPWMRIDQTIVPWTALWLFYFEDWLANGDWRGGGMHPDLRGERGERPPRRRNSKHTTGKAAL